MSAIKRPGAGETAGIKRSMERCWSARGETRRRTTSTSLCGICLHGGLPYVAVKHVVIERGKVVEVVYHREVLSKLVDRLFEICRAKTPGGRLPDAPTA